jgi:invasion protein IalB
MLKSFVALVAALVVAAPAAAQTPPADPAAPASTAQKARDPNRIICERQEEIGSRLGGTKICKTAQQWEQSRQQSRSDVDDLQRYTANPKPH